MGSKTTMQQRPLTDAEKKIYAQQSAYLDKATPVIYGLMDKGQSNLQNVYTPNWSDLYNNYNNEINTLISQYKDLTNGVLPSAYTDSKQTYYNRLYENTMGTGLAKMAKSGVINSSRFNTATNDWQKNLASQMSKDYTDDINTQNTLLNSRYNYLSAPMDAATKLNASSRNDALNYFDTASLLEGGNTNALNSISNNESSRTYMTQSQGLFDSLAKASTAYYGFK